MNIVPAIHTDIKQIVQLVNSAYRGEGSKKGWTTEADLLDGIRIDEDSLKEMMEKPDVVFLKYLDDDSKLLGSVYLQKQDAKLYLGMLTVSPEMQARGIGKQLLAASENHAKSTGCSTVKMTVISVRDELIAWYERHGYKKTGETEPFPTDVKFGIPKQHLEFVVMEKSVQ